MPSTESLVPRRDSGESELRATQQTRSATPQIWLVLSDKRGDNGQVYSIAEALGWPYEERILKMRDEYVLGKPKVKPSLYHIDVERSDTLEPPWPDLILTIGRRPSMAALWIREQSKGQSKIALIGKPSSRLEDYNLIVVSGENQLPPFANVVPITLPLMRVDEDAVRRATDAWRDRFSALPRPLVGVLVGGPTGPYRYDGKVASRLIEIAKGVKAVGGTPYITTSRRTPPNVVNALKSGLPEGAILFAWQADATENPYLGLLGHADGFLVTADSISMMVEVARLRQPLSILQLPLGRLESLDQIRRSFATWLFQSANENWGDRLRHGLANVLYRLHWMVQTRDFYRFHQDLVDRGLAIWNGLPLSPPTGDVPDDVGQVVERIKALAGVQTADVAAARACSV